MIFGEIESLFSIIDRVRGWKRPKAPSAQGSVAGRFIQLFESHQIHRNQIPEFFGYGLTIADVQDETSLVGKLTPELISRASDLFAVNKAWLEGSEPRIYARHAFYKSPHVFQAFLEDLLGNTQGANEISGILVVNSAKNRPKNGLLILKERIGVINDADISRLHLCDTWDLGYWKSAAYLAACIAMCFKRDVYVSGLKVSKSQLDSYISGEKLIVLSETFSSIHEESFSGEPWYPEDLALIPNVFLDFIDSEDHGFGHRAGLQLWLQLAKDGYMDNEYGADACQNFEAEYNKLIR